MTPLSGSDRERLRIIIIIQKFKINTHNSGAEQPNFLKIWQLLEYHSYDRYPRTSATEEDILVVRDFLDEGTTS